MSLKIYGSHIYTGKFSRYHSAFCCAVEKLLRTRVKICGITRPADAQFAVEAGVDALGLIFYPPSSRFISLEQGREIAAAVPPFVSLVAVFVDAKANEIERTLERLPIDLLQFHGNEAPAFCAGFATPYIKGIRMRENIDLNAEAGRYNSARILLCDTFEKDLVGGTGNAFNWNKLQDFPQPYILAGGLNPDNIVSAIQKLQPYAVDISTGVEAEKGIKDTGKIQRFMDAVRSADAEQHSRKGAEHAA